MLLLPSLGVSILGILIAPEKGRKRQTTNSFPKLKGSKAKLFSCPVKRERPGSFGNFKDLRKELDSDLRRGRKFHYNELFWRQFRGEPEQV